MSWGNTRWTGRLDEEHMCTITTLLCAGKRCFWKTTLKPYNCKTLDWSSSDYMLGHAFSAPGPIIFWLSCSAIEILSLEKMGWILPTANSWKCHVIYKDHIKSIKEWWCSNKWWHSKKKGKNLLGLHRELSPEKRKGCDSPELRNGAQQVQLCVPSSSLFYLPAFLLKNLDKPL